MYTPEAPERDAIAATVQKYIDGIGKTRPELLAEAFHPDATMTGHFGGKFRVTPKGTGEHIAEYMRKIEPTSVHSPKFKGTIVSITQHGTMASAEIAEDQLQGKDMKTFFQLHKINGAWLITAKATWAPD